MKVKKTGRSRSDSAKETIRDVEAPSSTAAPAAQQNDESLQTFFEALDDLVFVFEPGGRILFTNPAAQKHLGYTPEELARLTVLDLHPREQQPAAAKLLADLIAGKTSICPIPLQTKNGTGILVETKILNYQWHGRKALVGISHDITERKRVETDLQKFEFSIGQASDAIFWMTRDAGFSYVNEQACRSLGYTREELMRLHLWDIDPVFPKERWEANWQQCQENKGGSQHFETSHRGKDGSVFPVSISSKHLWFGETELHVVVARDVTERKQAEAKLLEASTLLEEMLNNSPLYIYFKDLQSRFMRVSKSLAQTLQISDPESIKGKTDADYFPPVHARETREEEQQIIRTGRPIIDKLDTVIMADGKQAWGLTTKLPWRDGVGNIVGTFGFTRDITAVREVGAELTHERQLLRTLIDLLPDTFYIKDLDSRFLVANEALAKHFGKETPAQLLGLTDADFYPAEQAASYRAEELKVFAGEPLIEHEGRCVSPTGQECVFSTTKVPFRDSHGRIQGLVGIGRNITERQQAEETIIRERQLLRTLIDLLPDIFYIKNMDSQFLMANATLAKSFGKDNYSQVVGLSDADFFPAGMAAACRAEEKKVLAGEPLIDHEDSVVFPDGRQYTLLTTKVPFRDGQGRIQGLVGIGRDITNRRLAEDALEKTSGRLKRINGCLLELGRDHDANINRLTALCGELLGATSAMYNRLEGNLLCSLGQWQTPPGFKSKDLAAGHICYDVLRDNQDDAVVITNLPQTAYAQSDSNVRAYGLRTYLGCAVKCGGKAVGTLCAVYNTDYRPTDDDRRILGIIASALGNEDTRKQAEAELNRLMTAIEQTPESVVITDTDGYIVFVNPAFERVTGYSRTEAVGQTPRLLKSDRQDPAFYRELWAKINAGEVWRGRFINKKKNGALFTEDAVIAPVRDEKNTVTHYIAIKRDITHELELEGQYRQTQKIDSIGRLAGGVAHDFNNILAVICGHTDLALAQVSSDSPLRSNLESIQESAERAANLTRQLLAFARRQVIEPRLINLNELIVNLNRMLHRLIGEDIKLVTNTAPDLGQIKADPGQIEQVLLNLVVNARDAMPDGGTLTICTDNVTLDEDYARRHLMIPGDYVTVTVSDTGMGMTEEVKQHIFEPFFTTKEQGKGTGLGLATCFGIIQQSNGHIHSESQVDKGTQFKIYLPRVCAVENAAAGPELPVSLPQGDETILLAEDEPSLRRLMARVLRTQGYNVLEAADGNEALALAQANGGKIQLLLTDVIMPGLSGKMLAEWLSQVNPSIRVLFISGYINNNAVRDAMSRPGTFFLQKPFNPLDLAKKVRAAIES